RGGGGRGRGLGRRNGPAGLGALVGEAAEVGLGALLLLLAEGAAVEEAVEGGAGLGGGALEGGGGLAVFGEGGARLLRQQHGRVAARPGLGLGGLGSAEGVLGVELPGGGALPLTLDLLTTEGVRLGLAFEALQCTGVGVAALGVDSDFGFEPSDAVHVRVEGGLPLGQRLLARHERRPLCLQRGLGGVHARRQALDLGAEVAALAVERAVLLGEAVVVPRGEGEFERFEATGEALVAGGLLRLP